MTLSKRSALDISIVLVLAYWIYQLLSGSFGPPSLPDDFATFAGKVAISKFIQFLAIYALLKLLGAGWEMMGFTGTDLKKQIIFGVLSGIILFIIFNVTLNSVMRTVFPFPDSANAGVMKYFTEPQNIYVWLLIGIFGGGVVEELVRIFCLTVFRERFGSYGLYFSLICSSLLFGWGHLYQGIGSAITVGLSGLTLGIIYIRRGSAIEVMIIHALGDVLAISAAFMLHGH